MEFRIKEGNVPISLNQFKKCQFLGLEVRLVEYYPVAAASPCWVFTLEIWTFSL